MASPLSFAWSPRLLLAGRTVRLPLRAPTPQVEVDLGGMRERGRRWSPRDGTLYLYLQAPDEGGQRTVSARRGGAAARVAIGVRTLTQLRQRADVDGVPWPRRWPLGGAARPSTKTRQTLTDHPTTAPDPAALTFWLESDDAAVWRQLPPAELPRSHFVNCHEGCPSCGTAVFSFHGFYPWQRRHTPADFRSTCPSCGVTFPDNDLVAGDYTSGAVVDDGYGYVDADGHLYLFAATYCRDQTRAFGGAIAQLAAHLRAVGLDAAPAAARRLGLMLLRYAAEEVYLAAVPQFRYGPTLGTERLWEWTTTGQTDWATEPDPVAALLRKGTQRYCIDTPYIAESLAVAYDTLWPLLRGDAEIPDRARALGLDLAGPEAAVALVEEMLACLLQVHLDGGAASNLPRVSEGVLVLLRALQRGDGQDPLRWVYDEGPDELRVFASNDFFPDGTPPEATGGYNDIHTNGLFCLEDHLRRLKADHPGAYAETDYPSLLDDPRAVRAAHAPHDIAVLGRAFHGFGDGGGPACQRRLPADAYHAPLPPAVLDIAARYTGDPSVARLRDDVAERRPRALGSTVLDGVGLIQLRTAGAPERAAACIAYGDASGHRHADLLDVQLWACDRPYLSDLGYPQSWATIAAWEGHWATHNTVWATVPGLAAGRLAGRGRLVRSLFVDGLQLVELEAWRWAAGPDGRWYRPGVTFRRLLALVETDGDGVALVDLARVRGGDEHWRVCRGLESEGLHLAGAEAAPRPGTVADAGGVRGDTARLAHPDHEGLAWMDDVAELSAADGFAGRWDLCREEGVHLDVHALRVSPGARAHTARAAAIMGTPEASGYRYRPVVWRRRSTGPDDASAFDLVFEPRVGAPNLAGARPIAARSRQGAGGVELTTAAGRRLRLWWNPEAGPDDEPCLFGDGAALLGPLAVDLDGRLLAVGAAAFDVDGRAVRGDAPVRTGRIVALDRKGCTVDVEGVGGGLTAGDRVVANPDRRGRSYRVERVEPLGGGRLRLRLDVTSVLGRGRVLACDGSAVRLQYGLFTRTGYLHGARLCAEGDEAAAPEVLSAWNPDRSHTEFQLAAAGPWPPGRWLHAVDYAVGDPVRWEVVALA